MPHDQIAIIESNTVTIATIFIIVIVCIHINHSITRINFHLNDTETKRWINWSTVNNIVDNR